MKWVRLLLFVLIALTIWGSIHYYVYNRISYYFNLSGTRRIYYGIIFFFLFISLLVARLIARLFPHSHYIPLIFHLLAYFWVGIVFYLFIYSLSADIIRIFLSRILKFPKNVYGIILLTLTIVTVIYGFFEAFSVRTITLNQKMKNLKETTRIVFLSDLHLGLNLNYLLLKKIIPEINSFSPDIILIGGDILDEEAKGIETYTKIFKRMNSRFGIFAVTGNHDIYAGEDLVVNFLKKANVHLLRNRIEVIKDIQVAGIEDESILGQKWKHVLEKILKKANPSLPLILLKHRPTGREIAKQYGVDLMLCGHTHKAQLFPLHLITSRVYRYYYGYHRENGLRIYVTSGLGTWGPPIRVMARPELVLITLKPDKIR